MEPKKKLAISLIGEAEAQLATSPFPSVANIYAAEQLVNGYRSILAKLAEAKRIIAEMELAPEGEEEESAE